MTEFTFVAILKFAAAVPLPVCYNKMAKIAINDDAIVPKTVPPELVLFWLFAQLVSVAIPKTEMKARIKIFFIITKILENKFPTT